MNNDSDHYDWWIDTDSESDLDVLDALDVADSGSDLDVLGLEYDGDTIESEEEFLGFLAGDFASDAHFFGILGL
jgi:hypothetical protein